MNLDSVIADMKKCPQTENQSVYEHGISVNRFYWQLRQIMSESCERHDWKLPSWISDYSDQIIAHQLSNEIVDMYTIHHDCGKPYCLEVDEDGRKHFPNHAQVSHDTWLKVSNNEQVARLLLWDMDMHTMKNDDVPLFCEKTSLEEACTLLLVSLAELHSNANMFGKEGVESTSFKIKFKQIDKRGKAICKVLFS